MKLKLYIPLLISILFLSTDVVSAQVSQDLCSGNIRTDRQAAQECVNKAQSQGTARGFSITCMVQDVMLYFTDPNTGLNYYLGTPCTVDGFSNFDAAGLAGWDSSIAGRINPGWDTLARDLESLRNPSSNTSNPLVPISNTFDSVKKYDPCTHQFFANFGSGFTPITSIGEARSLILSTDGRAAGVPLWVKNIVQNAPIYSPVYSRLASLNRLGNPMNSSSILPSTLDVSATNVPSQLLTPNYTPDCTATFSVLGLQTPGVPPTTTQTPTNTTPTTGGTSSNVPTAPTTSTTGSISTGIRNAISGIPTYNSNTQSIQMYMSSLTTLLQSYQSMLNSINNSQATGGSSISTNRLTSIPVYTSPSVGSNFASNSSMSNTCSELSRDLREGSVGTDVTVLTDFLVKEGLLTSSVSTFDSKVKTAVIALQERYASVVLAPAGLTSGTGYVGELTRNFINSRICPTTSTESRINTSYTNNYFNNTSNTTNGLGPVFTTNVKASMRVGDNWYIVITGLNPNETVYLIGGKKVNGVYPQDRTPFTANSFGTVILTGTHREDEVGEWQMTWQRSNLSTIATYNFFLQQ